jgi:HAD superfamily hydrolase (TIGR01509 family)
MIHAAIFDMDGILFDTERLCCDAWRAVAGDAGYRMDDELFLACVGRTSADTREIVMDSLGSGFPYDDLDAKAHVWIRSRMEEKGPPEKIGIRPLFEYLASRNIPLALATSTSERSARWMIERAGLTPYFSAWAFGNEVTHGKPAPDIFLLAKDRLGVADASRCVAFEDSPAGLTAALAAGMRPVFVRDMIDPDPALLARVWKTASRLDEAASDSFFAGI